MTDRLDFVRNTYIVISLTMEQQNHIIESLELCYSEAQYRQTNTNHCHLERLNIDWPTKITAILRGNE